MAYAIPVCDPTNVLNYSIGMRNLNFRKNLKQGVLAVFAFVGFCPFAALADMNAALNALELSRDNYISSFIGGVKNRPDHTPEVMFELFHDKPEPYSLYRFDLTNGHVEPVSLVEVNLDALPDFHVVTADVESLKLEIAPFYWNGAEFDVSPAIADDSPLRKWAMKWLDLEEATPSDEDGLGAYLHSITVPETSASSTSFSVDFGSAPLAAIRELIGLLHALGARRIRVHSESMSD